MAKLKYTRKVKDGWLFSPPKAAVRAGIVRNKHFKDLRVSKAEIKEMIRSVEEFQQGKIAGNSVMGTSTINQLIAHYRSTKHYDTLAAGSKKHYDMAFRAISGTPLGAKTLGAVQVRTLTAMLCNDIYQTWLKTSIPRAKSLSRIFSVLMSYCISLDIIQYNPMAKVKKPTHDKRSVVWTKDQVESFLTTAFSNFRWRNVGLLVYMAYEWCQRPTDIRTLEWSSLDLDNKVASIKQSKRGAEVYLPISSELLTMLEKQKVDYGFSEYVLPYLRKGDNQWVPYPANTMSSLVNEVLSEAGLPMELRAGDLRKTGIGELVDSGVDITSIMAVTGHKDLSSLTPYMKNTLTASTNALNKRKNL